MTDSMGYDLGNFEELTSKLNSINDVIEEKGQEILSLIKGLLAEGGAGNVVTATDDLSERLNSVTAQCREIIISIQNQLANTVEQHAANDNHGGNRLNTY